MVDIALDWKSIDWLPTETWSRDIFPKLKVQKLTQDDLGAACMLSD